MADEFDTDEWSEVMGAEPKDAPPKRRQAANLVAWVADLATAYLQTFLPEHKFRVVYTVKINAYDATYQDINWEAQGTHTTLIGALHELRGKLLEKANTQYAEMRKRIAAQNKAVIELAERTKHLKEVAEERQP